MKQISLICFRVYLEVCLVKNPTCLSRWSVRNADGENILNDFFGTEKQAVRYAEKQAKILEEDIYINCGEDIIDVTFA